MSEAMRLFMKDESDEAERIGRNEGISTGRSNVLKEMIRRGILIPEQGAQF